MSGIIKPLEDTKPASALATAAGSDSRFERAKRIEEFKDAWYKRNPVHEYNADTGEDMFWGTAMMVMEDFFNQNDQSLPPADTTKNDQ